jgi:hypothetical protein
MLYFKFKLLKHKNKNGQILKFIMHFKEILLFTLIIKVFFSKRGLSLQTVL